MNYIIALQTVINIPGEAKELGYTTFFPLIWFPDQESAMKALQEERLPLGWVVVSEQQVGARPCQ